MIGSPLLTDRLAEIVGAEHVIVGAAAQKRLLKDFNWYSPLLSAFLRDPTSGVTVELIETPDSPDV